MITTRGFEIQNMPRFTPVDPELVALNPARATAGILDTLKIADAIKRQKAFQALQEELDATREARINAQNVGSNVTVAQGNKVLRQIPRIEGIENLQFANQESMLPAQGKLGLEQIGAQLATLPSSTAATIAGNVANKGLSDIQIATQPGRLDLAKIGIEGELGRSDINEANKDFLASQVIADKAKKDVQEEAKVALMKAQSKEAIAHGDYFDAGGAAAKEPDLYKRLKTMTDIENSHLNEMTKILNSTVPSPTGKGEKITLSQYLSLTRDKGTDAPAKTGFILKTEVPRNPEAENLVKQLQTVVERAKKAREQTDKLSLSIELGGEEKKASSPKAFATEADAQAAEDAGLLKIGDEITIGGVKGKWTK